jgi:Zn finger protein HypA/HybF involved in hydrogenase expression
MGPGECALQPSEDLLLGKLAVREGLCSREQVDECLRAQSLSHPPVPLGHLLLEKGYITTPQLKALLSRQHKKVMRCAACRLSYTVLTLSDRKTIHCPRCKGPLEEVRPGEPTRTDAEFATQALRRAPLPAPTATQVARTIKIECIICEQKIEAALDPSGRARCPSCHSTFVPRKK